MDQSEDDGMSQGLSGAGLPRRGGKRKVKDTWSVVDGGFAGAKRPEPPEGLTEREATFWRQVVSSEPPDFFSSFATRQMLVCLCHHHEEIEHLTGMLKKYRKQLMKSNDYIGFLRTRGAEVQRFAAMATKLRLTNQSRYRPTTASTAERSAPKLRPWEMDDPA
jgi:hypothetical protein